MLTRMQQRRGTQAEWNDSVIASTVILQAGELGLETDTGRFKIGNGTSVWQDLPYYLPDNNPSSAVSRQGKNNQDIYSRLSPLAPTYTQNFTGAQVLVPQSGTQTPLVVSGVSGQSAVLQRWRDSNDNTLASVDQTGKLTASGGASFGAAVNMNSNKITNVGSPTSDNDAVNKIYVDDAIAGLAWKEAVNLIAHGTGSNVALTGSTNTLVIDGHSALDSTDSGYRILLTAQTTASQNGIYVYNDNGTTYTLTRSTDADTYQELVGASVYVQEGTLYGTSSWVQSNHYLSSFSGQTWVQFSGAALITAGTGMTKDGNKLDVVGTADRITANADSIDIASTYAGQTSITTVGTIGTGTWNASVIDETVGGTGQSSYAVGDILYADTTTSLNKLTSGTAGIPLLAGGANTAPSYGQVNTGGIANDAVTYDKIQNISAQYRVLGRISTGSGNTEELNSDELMTIINLGNTDVSFNLLPATTSGGNNGTAETVARGDHTHTLDNLSDVSITGTPVQRQVLKFNGTTWINELPSGGISVGDTPPGDASEGDAWFDSTDGSLYVYYNDDVGSPSAQWVQVKANSALEASILTRVSALEARSTDIEAANAVRVANQAERDSVYPAPVQGNTVFRADLGYEEKYYAAYNATTNPDGTKGTPGWYEFRGAAPLSENYIINSGFDIWQRGTSTTTAAAAYRTADRWATWISAGSGTIQQDTAYPAPGCDSGIRFTSSASGSSIVYYYTIETKDAIKLAGKVATLSAYIASPAGKSVQLSMWSSTTTDNTFSGSWDAVSAESFTATSTRTRYFINGSIPANAKTVQIRVFASSVNNTEFISFSGVQLEDGPVPTDYRRNQPNIQAELAACQRYYYRISSGSNAYTWFGSGGSSSTAVYLSFPFPSTMRTIPLLDSSAASTFQGVPSGTVSALSIQADGASVTMAAVLMQGTGFGAGTTIRGNNTTSAYLGFNAEL